MATETSGKSPVADTSKEPPKKKSCCHRKIFKATELPIYDTHKTKHEGFELIKAPTGILESYISIGRKSVEQFAGPIEGAKDRVVNIYETGVAHTQSTYAYITNDTSMIPRVGAITLGGLLGLLLSARKGFIKKTLYGATGAGIAASICYPKQAKEISNNAYTKITTDGFKVVKEQTGYDLDKVFKWNLPKFPDFSTILKDFGQQFSKGKTPEGDPGQSNPADKDMYTTRGK